MGALLAVGAAEDAGVFERSLAWSLGLGPEGSERVLLRQARQVQRRLALGFDLAVGAISEITALFYRLSARRRQRQGKVRCERRARHQLEGNAYFTCKRSGKFQT